MQVLSYLANSNHVEDFSSAPESLPMSTGTVLDRRQATSRLTPKSMCRVLSGLASASASSTSERILQEPS
jgi:hypothetical protein